MENLCQNRYKKAIAKYLIKKQFWVDSSELQQKTLGRTRLWRYAIGLSSFNKLWDLDGTLIIIVE